MTRFTVFLERLFVWTGGGVFIASLAWCAYTYAIIWAAPVSSRSGLADAVPSAAAPWIPLALDALLLGVFAVHHSLFARASMKRRLSRAIPERLLRAVYVWIASVLLVGTCTLWEPIGGDLYQSLGMWRLVHGGVQLLGVGLIALAVR